MRNAKRLHYINEDPHWAEYAEWPSWDEKVTRVLRKDKIGDWLTTGVLLFVIAVCLEVTWRFVR